MENRMPICNPTILLNFLGILSLAAAACSGGESSSDTADWDATSHLRWDLPPDGLLADHSTLSDVVPTDLPPNSEVSVPYPDTLFDVAKDLCTRDCSVQPDIASGDAGGDDTLADVAHNDALLDIAEPDILEFSSTDDDTLGEVADISVDALIPTEPWLAGALAELPQKNELLDLPGGGSGHPVVTSNNPESFTGEGFLYETARMDPVRGGSVNPMNGTFGVYLHHLNNSGHTMYVHILLTNPNEGDVVVSGFGSGYNQTDEAMGFGAGPDVKVASDWLNGTYSHTLAPTTIKSFKAAHGWVKVVPNGQEVDGRFEFAASQGVYVYVIAADTNDVNDAVMLSQTAAPGNIKPPGSPPPPFGREAGVYAFDTWAGAWELDLPPADQAYHVGYIVNTANGAGVDQIQAFPALTHFIDSSAESVGMYGNTYLLDVGFNNPSPLPRVVEVHFAALGGGSPSFFFNGPIKFDGDNVMTILKPTARVQKLGEVAVPAGASATTSLEIFVQGLSSIPQALFFVVN